MPFRMPHSGYAFLKEHQQLLDPLLQSIQAFAIALNWIRLVHELLG